MSGATVAPQEVLVKIYIDLDDQWVGRYRGPNHNYVCIIPCIVIRWKRRVDKN